jgi:hypothetical protein
VYTILCVIDGKGTYSWPDGSKYTGGFLNGKKHGYGIHSDPEGTTYDGEWEHDK